MTHPFNCRGNLLCLPRTVLLLITQNAILISVAVAPWCFMNFLCFAMSIHLHHHHHHRLSCSASPMTEWMMMVGQSWLPFSPSHNIVVIGIGIKKHFPTIRIIRVFAWASQPQSTYSANWTIWWGRGRTSTSAAGVVGNVFNRVSGGWGLFLKHSSW